MKQINKKKNCGERKLYLEYLQIIHYQKHLVSNKKLRSVQRNREKTQATENFCFL